MSKYIKALKSSTELKKRYLAYNKSAKERDRKPLTYARWLKSQSLKGTEPGVDPKEKKKTTGAIGATKRTQAAKGEAIRQGTGGRYGSTKR